MTIPLPTPEWPASLLEEGPPEDPTILLRGQLTIGPARFMLMAVRVDPVRFGPDFRADQDLAIYADYQLPAMLDIVSELVSVSEPSTLRLGRDQYVMWMLPASDDV
jgi:hypothetical protein